MRVIRVRFELLSEVTVDRLFEATGVYVLWSPRAQVRPTYLGEGYLLDRLGQHVRQFGPGLVGAVAILGYDNTVRLKEEAQIVEHLLLAAADRVDRAPSSNTSAGIRAGVEKIFRSHGILRVRVTGIDPLRAPWMSGIRLTTPKEIELFRGGPGEEPFLRDGWNRRPLRVR